MWDRKLRDLPLRVRGFFALLVFGALLSVINLLSLLVSSSSLEVMYRSILLLVGIIIATIGGVLLVRASRRYSPPRV